MEGALNVLRPPEVRRSGSFVKPAADWLQQRARLLRSSLRPQQFGKTRGAAQFQGLRPLTTRHFDRFPEMRFGFSDLRWVECDKNLRSLPMQFRFP